MEITVQEILEAANEAYNHGEGRLSESLPLGERQDSLADFIANEIHDATLGMSGPDCFDAMIQASTEALESAVTQLQDVIGAIDSIGRKVD